MWYIKNSKNVLKSVLKKFRICPICDNLTPFEQNMTYLHQSLNNSVESTTNHSSRQRYPIWRRSWKVCEFHIEFQLAKPKSIEI